MNNDLLSIIDLSQKLGPALSERYALENSTEPVHNVEILFDDIARAIAYLNSKAFTCLHFGIL